MTNSEAAKANLRDLVSSWRAQVERGKMPLEKKKALIKGLDEFLNPMLPRLKRRAHSAEHRIIHNDGDNV